MNGRVIKRTDRYGNAVVCPYERKEKPVVLRESSALLLPAGLEVDYELDGNNDGSHNFSFFYFAVDGVFYDNSTNDLLLIGRRSLGTPELVTQLIELKPRIWGIIEETEPRVDYFCYNVSLPAFARTVQFNRELTYEGRYPGESHKSLLQVPERCTPDRKKLAELLAPTIKTRDLPFTARVEL